MIKDTPPTIYHLKGDEHSDFKEMTAKALDHYKETLQEDKRRLIDRYRLADVAIKVVGIGSVGTTCGIALMLAPDSEPRSCNSNKQKSQSSRPLRAVASSLIMVNA